MALGVLIGGYSFILNDGGSDLTDNSIPNELNDSSKNNVSLDNNTKVSNDNSNVKVIKDILDNDFKEMSSSFNSIQLAVTEDSDVPTPIFAFNGNVDYFIFPQDNQSSDPNQYPGFNNINKSEYILSPNYDKNIYIKIGQDFTDKYGFCVADGFFIPLGNITKEIPVDKICKLDCGIADCYFDLSSPYIYDYDNVSYYLEHGEFAPDVIIKQQQAIKDYYDNNYRKLGGHEDIYLNVHQDFTDKYILCIDCGRYVPLGDVTTPLKDIMICDYPTHFGKINYFDIDHPAVITPEEAYNSWDSYLEDLYSNPDYHPIHGDEPGYGGDYVEEPNDVTPINDELPQENVVVENPQIVADFTNVA